MRQITVYNPKDFSDNGMKNLPVHNAPHFKILLKFKAGQELPRPFQDIAGQVSLAIMEGTGEFFRKDGVSFPGKQGDVVKSEITAPHGFRARTAVRLLVTIASPI
jgi:quercetin dioxygenase-like cupin family protein